LFACPNRGIAEAIERSFHDVQARHQSHGEWFSLEPMLAIHALCIAFRAHLEIFVSPEITPFALEEIGVIEAERRFNLKVPTRPGVH
jgi:hypothetical protein